jgi:tape measure domain-containing protein
MATEVARLEARLTANTRDFDRGMRHADTSMSKAARGIGKGALVAGAAVGGLAVAGAGFAAKMGLDFFKVREQAEIAFTTMYKGDGKKARKFLDDLAKFAAKTPFEFPDLVRSSQRLMAMGTAGKDVMPIMEAVGDTVAAVGGGAEQIDMVTRAIGQVQAKGRLQAEEMMQLNEAGGFSWQDLAREINMSVPEAMEAVRDGQVSAGEFVEAFTSNATERFDGMMEKQSRTLSGMFSTFKDTFSQISADILTPFFEQAGDALSRVNEFLGKIAKAQTTKARIRIVWEGVKGASGDLFDSIRDQLMGTAGTLKPIKLPTGKIIEWQRVGASPGFIRTFQDAMEGVNWAKVGTTIGEAIGDALDFGRTAIRSMMQWVDAHVNEIADVGLKIMLAMISRLMDPAFWKENWQVVLTVAISAFPYGRVTMLGARIASLTIRAFGKTGARLIGSVLDVFARLFGRIPGILRSSFRFGFVYVAIERIKETAKSVWDWLRDHTRLIFGIIAVVTTGKLEKIRHMFALVRATAKFSWEFIRDKTQIVVDKVQRVIDKVRGLIKALRDLWNKAKGWLEDIGGLFGNLVPRVPNRNDFGGFGGGMVGPGSLGAVSTLASQAGLTMTSGFRPGDPGWHGQNRARDYAGSASQMVAFARQIARLFGPSLLELIHTPLGFGIKNGRRVANSFFGSAVMADHYDHVHVAMNRGGVVPGRRGAPVPVLAHGGETFIPTHRGGGGGFGNTIINLPPGSYIYDPEGLLRLIERASKTSGRRGGPRLNFGT